MKGSVVGPEDSAGGDIAVLGGVCSKVFPSPDTCGDADVAEPLAVEADDGEDGVSVSGLEDSGAGMAEEAACTLAVGLADGTGGSVLKIEAGPTGILPSAPGSCPFSPICPSCPLSSSPSPSTCWLASVELENVEAILTCLY